MLTDRQERWDGEGKVSRDWSKFPDKKHVWQTARGGGGQVEIQVCVRNVGHKSIFFVVHVFFSDVKVKRKMSTSTVCQRCRLSHVSAFTFLLVHTSVCVPLRVCASYRVAGAVGVGEGVVHTSETVPL